MATVLKLNPIPEGEAPVTDTETDTQQATPTKEAHPLDAIVERVVNAEKPDMAQLTKIYLKLRAAHQDLKKQAAEKARPLIENMDRIEACFLATMQELGVDSLKNEAGTPYKSEKVSITVADNAAFVDFVLRRAVQALPLSDDARETIVQTIVDSGQLALIEARASKTAVEELMAETKELPAGLNRRSELTVNVRSS